MSIDKRVALSRSSSRGRPPESNSKYEYWALRISTGFRFSDSNITNLRNKVMLELMARGDMRIGEVLKIKPGDVKDRKIKLPDPKN